MRSIEWSQRKNLNNKIERKSRTNFGSLFALKIFKKIHLLFLGKKNIQANPLQWASSTKFSNLLGLAWNTLVEELK